MRSLKILLLFLLLFSGCNKQQKSKTDVVPSISVDFAYSQPNLELNDIAKSISFIRLETNSDCLLRGISKVEIHDGRIYIFDSSYPGNLYCFDFHGKFMFKVGERGNGPGEYVSLLDFAVDIENKCLWLGDDAKKILKYDLYGIFLEQHITDFSIKNLCIIDAKEGLMAIRLGYYKDKDYSFIIYSMKEEKILYQKESENLNIIRTIATRVFSNSEERIVYT